MRKGKDMKKIVALLLGAVMILALAACGSQTGDGNTSETTKSGSNGKEAVGAWAITEGDFSLTENKEAAAAFEKATEQFDEFMYSPVAVLGSQVVSGMNYSYLCRGKGVVPGAEAEYAILNVYQDLKGNAHITGTSSLIEIAGEKTVGAWDSNPGDYALDKNPDVKKAFDAAVAKLDGVNYTPIAYIGSQVVSGKNYAVFCSKTPVTPDAETTFCVLTVYADTQGNSEVTEVKDVDLFVNN